MNNNTINLGCCPICFSPYNHSDHEPRIVPLCGHSICLACLGTIMTEDDHVFRCPICLRRVKFAKIETTCFPKNYSLLDLTEKLKTHEFCGTHHSQLELVCLKCKVKVCGKCVFRGEHRTHEVDVIEDYMKDTAERATDLKSWIECFDSQYKVPEKLLSNQESEIVRLVNASFEKYIQTVLEKKANIIWELKNSFRKIKSLNDDEENLDIEAVGGDIFEWKEKLKTSISKWNNNNSLIMALDIREHDSGISKELKKWTESSSSSKFYNKLKEVPVKVLPILEKMKFFDDQIQDSVSQLFKTPYNSVVIDIDPSKLSNTSFENCVQLTEFVTPEERVVNNYYLDNQNFTHHYIDKVQQLLFSSSRVTSLYIKTTTSLLSRDRSKFIFSGLSVMPYLTDISIEITEDRLFDEQIIEDFAHCLQSITTLQNFKLIISNASKLTSPILTRLFRSLGGNKSLENIVLRLPTTQALSDESLQSLAFSLSSLMKLNSLELIFGDARTITELGLIPLASSFKKLGALKKLKVGLANSTVGDESIKSFGQHIEGLKELRELDLCFKGCSEITNSGISNFSALLSHVINLENLILDFESCKHLNDKGISPLAEGLSQLINLSSLSLIFDRCLLLTDISLSNLGESFIPMKSLKSLTVSLRDCSIVGDQGITSLNKGISQIQSLTSLTLNLTSLSKMSMESIFSISDAVKSFKELKAIALEFENCAGVNDEGVTSIFESICYDAKLERIRLNVRDCANVGNNLLKNVGNTISKFESLQELDIDFTNCAKVSDGGISTFTIFLPGLHNLNRLALKFTNLSKVSDEGVSQLASALQNLPHLEELELNLLGAPAVTMNSVNQVNENISRLKPAFVNVVY